MTKNKPLKERNQDIKEFIQAIEEEIEFNVNNGYSEEKSIKSMIRDYRECERDKEANKDGGYTFGLRYLKNKLGSDEK